ncbi:hypothetical protein B0H19DRAFT_1188839 [Mycena capillaripes]|nr:hypothetical protein B0H19DRAFT_1188839 [Mycena capillaripes]
MDGETSPLLSGTPTPTIHSDSDSYYASQDPRASFTWLIPVVVIATLSDALTAYSRQSLFRQYVCEEMGRLPSTPDPSLLQIDEGIHSMALARLDCSSPSPSSVSVHVASMIVTCILSTLSTGWWSRLGDMHGRRYTLMVSVLGSIFLNLIFVLVASSPALQGLAQPLMFTGVLLEGLLGGSATLQGAVNAYTADVSPAGSWSTMFSMLQGLLVLSNVLGGGIGLGMDFIKPYLSFGVSAALGGINLAFIFFFLPESLPEEFQDDRPLKPILKDVRSSIYSTVTIFANDHRLAFYGLALFLYSLTSRVESYELLILQRVLPGSTPFEAGLFLTLGLFARMAAFFLLFPAMIYFFKRRSPLSLATSTKQYFSSVMSIDGSAARYSVWADLISQLIIIITPTSSSAIFFLLALMTPLTVGIKPALYALIAVYLEFLGGAPRRGALFGAISVVEMVGKTLSYIMYVPTYDSLWRTSVKVGFMLTAALLAVVAMFLWPGGGPERIPRDSPERIRIVVSGETVAQDPSTFSPVYRRHGVAGDGDAQ